MSKSIVAQYLNRYAEDEASQLEGFNSRPFKHCIVVPCFDEAPAFFERLRQSLLIKETLVIVVINQPTNTTISPKNIQLFSYFRRSSPLWHHANLTLLDAEQHGAWLLVDRFSQGRQIPLKQGVGLARKIGCDLAAKLKQLGFIVSDWIHSTDADAHLPDNYFDLPEIGCAAVFDFKHTKSTEANTQNDEAVEEATLCYERAIKYYVAGLQWAGSPYAFNTVGSAIAVNQEAYCKVRGFPKKSGGEDFYLLNKLAKLEPLVRARHITIKLESRISQRAPFGTGQAVRQILADTEQSGAVRSFTYYHPKTFEYLKVWLDQVPKLWYEGSLHENQYNDLPEPIKQALSSLNIQELFLHMAKQVNSLEQYQKAVHDWFDGFRTLKFIRYLKERFPNMPVEECIRQSPFAHHLPIETDTTNSKLLC